MLTKKTAFNNVESLESLQYMLIFNSIMSFSKVKGVNKQYSGYFVCFFPYRLMVLVAKVLDTVALRQGHEAEPQVAEVLGVTRMDMIRTEIIGVCERKAREARLRGFGHVQYQ